MENRFLYLGANNWLAYAPFPTRLNSGNGLLRVILSAYFYLPVQNPDNKSSNGSAIIDHRPGRDPPGRLPSLQRGLKITIAPMTGSWFRCSWVESFRRGYP
jgi:hypothetical protein